MPIFVRYAELLLLLLLSVLSDIKTFKIKNGIVLMFAAAGLLTNLLSGGLPSLTDSVLGAVVPAVLLFALFALRMLGAGDIKLFCAIGAIGGLAFTLYGIAFSFITGGIMAIFIMALRGNFKERVKYLLSYLKTCFLTLSFKPYTDFDNKSDGGKFRFSYAIACGTILQMLMEVLN